MSTTNKFMNRMFRRIGGVVWDVVSGGIGLQTENGIYTVSLAEDGTASLNVNPLDTFGLALPAFATQATFEQVEPLDIIVGDQGIIGWVVDKTNTSFKVLDHNGHTKTYTPPKVAIMGTNGVLVVRNLMNLAGGASGAANIANNPLVLMALMNGDEGGLEKVLPLLLMTGGLGGGAAAGGAAANPMAAMLPFLLMKDGGFGGLGGKGGKMDPMMLMAMSGGFGGGAGGMNPMLMMALMGDGDLFGSAKTTSPSVGRSVPALGQAFPPPLKPI
jgi:hypothetical protein